MLRPLQQKFESLEGSIVALEAQLEMTNEGLAQAAQAKDKDGIVRLSTEAARLRKQIDVQFARLEQVTEEHDRHASEFDQKLTG